MLEPLSTDEALLQLRLIICRWLVGVPTRDDATRVAASLGREAEALSRVAGDLPVARRQRPGPTK